VLLVATSLTLFLLDPVATLYVRFRRGARLGQAHREHAYQQFVRPGQRHSLAVGRLLLAAAAVSVIAVVAYQRPAWLPLSLAVAVVTFAVEWRLAFRRS